MPDGGESFSDNSLAESVGIVAEHLENRLHGHVSRKLGLGGTLLTQQAMVSGEIDVYPEYTGTALTAVLKASPLKDPSQPEHATKNRPVCVGDQIVARPIMYVALTYDHRIIDGREAVLFLRKIKECVEDPKLMLFDL